MANEIEIYRGDTRTITVTVKNSAGSLVNLTGYTMRMTVKSDKTSADSAAIISKTATITDPTTGVGTFALTVTDTTQTAGIYYYDVQISNSTPSVYTVIAPTTFTIIEDCTKTY